jgi:fructosamine-3-kinase
MPPHGRIAAGIVRLSGATDGAIMTSLPERIGGAVGVAVTQIRLLRRQHGFQHVAGTLADGRAFFAKAATETRSGASAHGTEPSLAWVGPYTGAVPGPHAAAFTAEANGLRWLAAADSGPPLPRVLGVAGDLLVVELIQHQEQPSPGAARQLGADLALMHAAGAAAFGAPWPGYIASLPLDNTQLADTAGRDWGSWYAERRLVPYLTMARDGGALSRADAGLVEAVIGRIGELAGPPEPPSRIHGDLWSGNLLWSGGRGWLIDPAAHGGHRETDLAMLSLFGAPRLAEIVAGYTETVPLADGWRSRVPLHQLHPLLVHVCLFGGGYAAQLAAAARAALAG